MSEHKLKKIFYTFSSRGVSDGIYAKIADIVINSGFEIEYKWYEEKGSKKSHKEIYSYVNEVIRKSDIVIADISIPSTGVGLQIEYAKQRKIPILVLYNRTLVKDGTYHLGGTQTPFVKYLAYNELEDIRKNLPDLMALLDEDKSEKLNFIATSRIKSALAEESKRMNISTSELLRNIVTEWFSEK